MRKLLLGMAGVAVFSAISLTAVSPSKAQGSDPKVKITNWGDGHTTMALAFGTIVNGVAGGEIYVQFDSNMGSYASATVRPESDGVSVMLDADPPFEPSESVGYNEGVDQLGNNIALIIFRVLTDPTTNWTSVLVQAYDDADVRQPDLLNRNIADAEVSQSPDTLPSDEAELFAMTQADAGWVLSTITDPLVINGDGSSGTIGQLLTFDPVTDPPDAAAATDISKETEDANAMDATGAHDLITDDPDISADPGASTSDIGNKPVEPSVPTTGDSGNNQIRNFALLALVAVAVGSLFTWRVRSKLLESTVRGTQPGDDNRPRSPHEQSPEEHSQQRRDAMFSLG